MPYISSPLKVGFGWWELRIYRAKGLKSALQAGTVEGRASAVGNFPLQPCRTLFKKSFFFGSSPLFSLLPGIGPIVFPKVL
jgi:hypothetical protein